MTRTWIGLALMCLPLLAQDLKQTEQASLQQALGEAGNSPVDFMRALENHLQKYPNSPRRAELERALVKTAVELKDDPRIIQYGELVLAREPDNLPLLVSVSTALVHRADKASAQKALEHTQRLLQLLEAARKEDEKTSFPPHDALRRREEQERTWAAAYILEAREQGLLGNRAEAAKFAKSSYDVYPSVEAAREEARWLSEAGQYQEALECLARAFTIAGLKSTDPDSAHDREQMAVIYRKLHGSEAGLGDLILKTYDDTSALFAARREELRQLDPNAQVRDALHFTLTGVDGEKLQLASLAGKVVVLDFWATWCVPCRAQHGLYEQVKARFKDTNDLVFLAIDTDEDHSLVKPFLETQKWTQRVYFDDGLQRLLRVSSIPTTIIFGKNGEITSRMNGFLPDRFVDMLTDRIDEALGRKPAAHTPAGASVQ